MRKNMNLAKAFTIIVVIQTVIALLIAYKGIDNWIATKFRWVYLGCIVIYLIYIPIAIIINIKKLERGNLKKRAMGFIKSFVGFSLLNYASNYFEISSTSLLNSIAIAFGVSFGIYFLDIAWLKKKEKYSLDYIYKKNNIT